MTVDLPDGLTRVLDHAYEMENQSLVVACPTAELASQLTHRLYTENPEDEFHVEHYPCTNDEDGTVDYYALLIRRLSYDRDVGWVSAEVADDPEFDITDAPEHDAAQTDLSDVTPETKEFAVAAETAHDPYRNFTILGHIVERDVNEFDSVHAAAEDAAVEAIETMPESVEDLVDDEFQVLIIEDAEWVSVKKAAEQASR